MVKNAFVLSPFFFGLLFLVLIAFISEQGGGVSGQSCNPGTGSGFGYNVQSTCSGCDLFMH
ncbi:hypothetical protein MKW94_006587 [Papaver nudicaule]|uniref:Transmembrane protein n=1 Tax=Papaver nudicaule TaxID=74823 RepID=A0AA41S4N6_PAPNU|nr:hypothetical protein [Papaver nudicaule]